MVVLNEEMRLTTLPLTPLLPDESTRPCECCLRPTIMSRSSRRSGFRRNGTWYARRCKACDYVAMTETSEEEENARIDAWEAREAAGEQLPDPEPHLAGRGMAKDAVRIPSGPFLAWLDVRQAEFARDHAKTAAASLAAHLGVAEKTIYRWRTENTLDEEVADRALSRDGRWTLQDLDAYSWPAYVPPVARTLAAGWSRLTYRGPCSERGCPELRTDDSLFCSEHAKRLARIRAEFDEDRKAMHAAGGDPQKKVKPARSVPTCVRPGCFEPRHPPAAFCPVCQAMGWKEDRD